MSDEEKRKDRRKHPRKKLRVLIKFTEFLIFESFTYDVSLNGVFVLLDSDEIMARVTLGLNLEFYLEYKLDLMIKAMGIVKRIQSEDEPGRPRGFAMGITEMSEDNRLLFEGIVNSISSSCLNGSVTEL